MASQRNAHIVSQLVNKIKKAELHTIIDSAKLDIIFGNESWLILKTRKVSRTPLVHSLIPCMVHPTMEYTSCVWDQKTNTNIKKLEMVKRRASCFVKGDYDRTSSITAMLMQWTCLDPLQEQKQQAKATILTVIQEVTTWNSLYHSHSRMHTYALLFFPAPQWYGINYNCRLSQCLD